MDSALSLLKGEINQTLESEHDLAKWKLVVTAALGATAFGLSKESNPNYWLLLVIPFVCAYMDLYAYQYQARIIMIGRFLRETPGDDRLLQKYELRCDEFRDKGVFSLGTQAGFGSSLGASILGPAVYLAQHWHEIFANKISMSHWVAAVIWIGGIFLLIYLKTAGQRNIKLINTLPLEAAKTAPPATPQSGK